MNRFATVVFNIQYYVGDNNTYLDLDGLCIATILIAFSDLGCFFNCMLEGFYWIRFIVFHSYLFKYCCNSIEAIVFKLHIQFVSCNCTLIISQRYWPIYVTLHTICIGIKKLQIGVIWLLIQSYTTSILEC